MLLTHGIPAPAHSQQKDKRVGSLSRWGAILPQKQPVLPKSQPDVQDFQGFSCFLTPVTTFCPQKLQYFSAVLKHTASRHHPYFNVSLTDIPRRDKKSPYMLKTDDLLLLVHLTCANSLVSHNFVDTQMLQDREPIMNLRRWKDSLGRKTFGCHIQTHTLHSLLCWFD